MKAENISTWLHKHDSDEGSHKTYLTHVMGKFKYNNKACTKGGRGSEMVAISIRRYSMDGYNAVVFNQHCMVCK